MSTSKETAGRDGSKPQRQKKTPISAGRIRELMIQRRENGRVIAEMKAKQMGALFCFDHQSMSARQTAYGDTVDMLEVKNKEIESQVGEVVLWANWFVKDEIERMNNKLRDDFSKEIVTCRQSLRACGILVMISFVLSIAAATAAFIL